MSAIAVFDMVSTPRCEVEACDTAPFIERMAAAVANPLPHHAGAFVFMVDGYNDTEDEIYSIPEIRAYYRKLDQEWPYLLFFANTELESLPVITWCLMDNITSAKAVGTKAVTKYDIPELLRWIDGRLLPMNSLFEKAYRHEIADAFYLTGSVSHPCEQAVLDRTCAVFQTYNLPFNEDL
jgi:hypothetical protein